ncbi:MAG TPA: branched-chain amino acid ABC transporter ATP-binding protein/permease [Acidimicrobiales bacterium]|nr:branched-chain amino acid ABC transporter ATP-binding protein/permease [Acidimicrobiales bacterium]
METVTSRILPSLCGRGRWVPLALIAFAWLAAPWIGVDVYWVTQLSLMAVLTLIVSGLNLSYGYAGELSLSQVFMFAVGAYVAGYEALHGPNDLALAVVSGAAAAGLAGLVIGIPGLRLGGWALAMVSFFVVLLIPSLVEVFPAWTGGYGGLFDLPTPNLFGFALTPNELYIVTVAVTLAWLAVFRNLVVSRHGNALRVLRQSPILASSLGIPVYRIKLFAYVAGALPAGMAGAFFAYSERLVSDTAFTFTFAIAIIASSILGGAESVYGAVLGSVLLEVLTFQTSAFQTYSLLVYGAFLVAGGVLLRGGAATVGRRLVGRWAPVAEVAPPTGPRPVEQVQGAGGTIEVQGLHMSFGGLAALTDVHMRAEAGQVTAIIGTNGSGKTTLVNLISGFLRPDKGEIFLDGERIDGARPHRVAAAGVSRTFQTPLVPTSMTSVDAVAIARYTRPNVGVLRSVARTGRFRAVRAEDRRLGSHYLDLVGLTGQASSNAATLPLGSRRLLEVARALVTGPRAVLLDEPASGLERGEVDNLHRVIREVKQRGTTVVLIEHNFRFVMDLADRVYVFDQGRIIAEGAPSEIESSPAVVQSFLGVSEGDALISGSTRPARAETEA